MWRVTSDAWVIIPLVYHYGVLPCRAFRDTSHHIVSPGGNLLGKPASLQLKSPQKSPPSSSVGTKLYLRLEPRLKTQPFVLSTNAREDSNIASPSVVQAARALLVESVSLECASEDPEERRAGLELI